MISHRDEENNYGVGDSEEPIYSRNSGFGESKGKYNSITPMPEGQYKIPSDSIGSKSAIKAKDGPVYKIPSDS